jgi:hypothetical protein
VFDGEDFKVRKINIKEECNILRKID